MTNQWKLGVRTHWPKLVLVFIVFALMVGVSYTYVSTIIREQLRDTARQNLLTVEANFRTALREPEAVLVAATVSLRYHLNQNRLSAMQDYMGRFTRWMQANDDHLTGFNELYGLIDGKYMNGTGWLPPSDYIPEERPWYLVGKAAGGRIGVTTPYVDAITHDAVIAYAQELFDDSGLSRGVVAVDVPLERLASYITSVQLSKEGYTMLLAQDGTVLAHNNQNRVGKFLGELSPGFSVVAGKLPEADDLSEWRVADARDGPSVVFIKRLDNGWYIGMVVSDDVYYGDVQSMALILTLVGLLFAITLSVILLRLSLAQISAEEANSIKSLFLARMSHDIRTPMNAILGISELVLREPISQTVRAYVTDVKQAGLNLLSLINDILDLSRIESGKMELSETEYDLPSLIHDVVTLIKMRIGEVPLDFLIFIDSQIPAVLIGDDARIRQVLLNLLTNAVKYTHQGEICFSIQGNLLGEPSEDGINEIELVCEVQDSGIGIKPEDLHKLFSDFTRLDVNLNSSVEGSGLGLAISRNLTVMMGGNITVRSEYGKGSVFTASFRQKFRTSVRLAQVEHPEEKAVLIYDQRRKASEWLLRTLQNLSVYAEATDTQEAFERALGVRSYDFVFSPYSLIETVTRILAERKLSTVAVALDANPIEPVPPGARAITLPAYALLVANVLNGKADKRLTSSIVETGIRFTLPDVKVLVVDDIDVNLRVSKGLLSCYKMHVDCALSGFEAIKLAQKTRYDIIFMDHMMPQMDGVETTARLRALGGEFEKITIVALTANAVSGMRDMFLSNGFNDFLSKPIETSKLNSILEHWIPKTRRVVPTLNTQTEAEPVSEPESSSADIVAMEGVDIALGLSRIGGKAEDYLEILGAFVQNVEDRLAQLDPGTEDLKTFTIHIHALKSAAANIGAMPVSEAAAALEAAGASQNRDFIQAHWGDFVAALKALNATIRNALQNMQTPVGDVTDGTPPPEAYEILAELKNSIHALEIDSVDAALERLLRLPLSTKWREQAKALSNMMLLARFDEALATIEALEAER